MGLGQLIKAILLPVPLKSTSLTYLSAALLFRIEHGRAVVLEPRIQVEYHPENVEIAQLHQAFAQRCGNRFRERIDHTTHILHHRQAVQVERGKRNVKLGLLEAFDESVQRQQGIVVLAQELPVGFV